jgi:hypothetical protein
MGLSGRNLRRYLAVLAAPAPVQEALERGALTLVQAARVAAQTKPVRKAIAQALEAGEEPKGVLAARLARPVSKRSDAETANATFVLTVNKAVYAVAGREDEVAALGVFSADREDLTRAAALIDRMLKVPAQKDDKNLERARAKRLLPALFKAAREAESAATG